MIYILGFVAVVVATYYIYKTARDTGRNAVGWALLTLAAGLGLQIFLPTLISILIVVTMAFLGKPLKSINELPWSMETILVLIGLAASFVGIWTIMRRVSVFPDEKNFVAPPAPPNFDGR